MNKLYKILSIIVFLTFFTKYIQAQPYEVSVYSVTSSVPAQPGTEVEKCIDGDDSTNFHTLWSILGVPDTIDFFFVDHRAITNFEYTPRLSGPNGIWSHIEVWYSTATAPSNFTLQAAISWPENNQKKSYNFTGAGLVDPAVIRIVVKAAKTNFSSCAEMRFYSSQPPSSNECEILPTGISGLADEKIDIIGAKDNNHQNGQDVSKSFDNKTSTLYHSRWSGGGFPVELKYAFNGVDEINYLAYTPRQDGNINGLFGDIEIWYKTTSGGNFIKLMDYDCGFQSNIQKIEFPQAIQNPDTILIKVLNGKNNFASCAEIQFFKDGPLHATLYTDIFIDNIYSALKPSVVQANIDTISIPFFKSLAQCMYNDTYNSKFRVQDYIVYPKVSTTASNLKTSSYSQFENPTGIFFKAGDTAVIFVDNFSAPGISLRVRDFAKDDAATDDTYLLSPGSNIFPIQNDGLSYINYYYNDNTFSPIKINIATGKVNGYFDAAQDLNSDWLELLSNNTYPNLDIKGKYVQLNYNKGALKANEPFDGLGLVAAYDSIVRVEHVLMGLVKYNKVPKNHMFGYSSASGGYYAGGLGAHFDLSWGSKNITSIAGLDIWGIPHEFGHVNQTRPGLKWLGMTEVTNNLFSIWCQYNMSRSRKHVTRLELDYGKADASSPNIIGGRFNSYLDMSVIDSVHIQTQNVFNILTPLWQLELYYQMAGACKNAPTLWDELSGVAPPPATGVDYAHWLADVHEMTRNSDQTGLTNGQLLLNFVKNTCDAVQEDLTGFFIKTGFLRPINKKIDDYGTGYLVITQYDIDTLIASIKTKGYSTPISPVINYLSSNSVNAYKNQLPMQGITGMGVEVLPGQIKIDTIIWKNVTVFETYFNDTLKHITLMGTGDATSATTTVQYPDRGMKIYAVGFDGFRKLVYPVSPAPVKFISISANLLTSTEVDVKWQVGVEENISEYEIERSVDGINFRPIGSVKAQHLVNYQYTDANSLTGVLYYRIKAVNQDRSFEYSTIISINKEKGNSLTGMIYPNPTTGLLNVTFENTGLVKLIQMYNASGDLALIQNVDINSTSASINIEQLPTGVYILKMVKNDGVYTKRIVKF